MEKPFALIIEDDRDIAALFRHVLDIAGYRTEVVMHGGEAIERLQSILPDIVLLDLTLPGVPGSVILEDMRADPRLKDVPVLVITAHAHVADSLPVEPDLVLLKPVNLEQLSNLVQRLRHPAKSIRETPWDAVTHMYNRGFFTVRLTYSLERAKQLVASRFGVVFVDIEPFIGLRKTMALSQFNELLQDNLSVPNDAECRLKNLSYLLGFNIDLDHPFWLDHVPSPCTHLREGRSDGNPQIRSLRDVVG